MSLFGPCGCCGPTCGAATDIFRDGFDTERLGTRRTLNHWDVLAGNLDVIGAPGYFNILPGNGYYLDLSGSIPTIYDATIRTKDDITVPAGSHVLSMKLAGNWRQDISPVSVRVQFGPIDAVVDITDWQMPFTEYIWPVAGPFTDRITIQQLPGPTGRVPFYGTLLDCVRVYADI